ncbi:hypothetical protein TFLX_03869 [Thermoflexales bacterium]|nr:hypothetical protein TFLX_03869 [Thermoflexales bacterium]
MNLLIASSRTAVPGECAKQPTSARWAEEMGNSRREGKADQLPAQTRVRSNFALKLKSTSFAIKVLC